MKNSKNALILVLGVWSAINATSPSRPSPQSITQEIPFEREKMKDWGSRKHEENSFTPHERPWPTQQEFLRRLKNIEKKASRQSFGLIIPALEPDVRLRNGEFKDSSHGATVFWPSYLRKHSIAKFNTTPSHEFYDWVMSHPHGADAKPTPCLSCKTYKQNTAQDIPFKRELMENWQSSKHEEADFTPGKYPWPTQQLFLLRLKNIQKKADVTMYRSYVTVSGVPLFQQGYFQDSSHGTTVNWPSYLTKSRYINQFNALPSREFYTLGNDSSTWYM